MEQLTAALAPLTAAHAQFTAMEAKVDAIQSQLTCSMGSLDKFTDGLRQDLQGELQALESRLDKKFQLKVDCEVADDLMGTPGSLSCVMEERFTKLEAQIQSISLPPSTTSTTSWSSRTTGTASNAKMRRTEFQKTDEDIPDPLRRWIHGWPRPVLESHRSQHYQQLISSLSSSKPQIAAGLTAKFQRTSTSYSVKFANEKHAEEFGEWAATTGNIPSWKDVRDNAIYKIKARSDMPHDARLKKRVLSSLWHSARSALTEKGHDLNVIQTGANGYRGVFTLVDTKNDDYYELFRVEECRNGHYFIKANPDQCAIWGLTHDITNKVIEDAAKL